jgi:cbb3-type cytochrome oxidase subunit 3
MQRTGRKKEWAILVFCLFFLGVTPPVIMVFDQPTLIFNYPLSFLYLYGFWALVILFIAIGARKRQMPDADRMQMPAPSNDTIGSAQTELSDAK